MELLVLGGTRFVGRAVITDAVERGWRVTAVHRGMTGAPPGGATSILVDRTDGTALSAALDGRRWDVVVDTWSGAPSVASSAPRFMSG